MTPAPARAPAGAPPPWPPPCSASGRRGAGRPLEGYGCGTTKSPMLPTTLPAALDALEERTPRSPSCSAGLHRSPTSRTKRIRDEVERCQRHVTGWSSPSTPSTSERPGRRTPGDHACQPTVATPTTAAELRERLAEPLPLADVDLADLSLNFATEPRPGGCSHTHCATRTVHWQEEDTPNSGFWAVTGLRRHRGRRPRRADVHVDGVRQPRRGRRGPDQRSAPPSWRWTASATAPCAASSSASSAQRASSTATRTSARPDRPDPGRRPAQGRFDFVQEISADFPINSARRLLDVPPEDSQQLIDWGSRIIGNTDPDYADVLLHGAESEQYRDLPFRSPPSKSSSTGGSWPASGAAGRHRHRLAARQRDPARRSAALRPGLRQLLPAAGRRRQRDDPARHVPRHAGAAPAPRAAGPPAGRPVADPSATEEFLRWASPSTTSVAPPPATSSSAASAHQEGDKVVMWYASGNRDEAVFTDPYDLDVARENNDHVTFGKGSPHLCLGNLLARAEIRIMFENSSRAWPTSSWPVTCRACAPTSSTASRSCRSRSPWPDPARWPAAGGEGRHLPRTLTPRALTRLMSGLRSSSLASSRAPAARIGSRPRHARAPAAGVRHARPASRSAPPRTAPPAG